MKRDRVLNEFLKKIKNHFGNHLKKVILFGSMARGDSHAQSDYDLLLIFDRVNKEAESFVEDFASEILVKYGRMFSIFLLSQRQLEDMRFEPFILNAQKEGMLL